MGLYISSRKVQNKTKGDKSVDKQKHVNIIQSVLKSFEATTL